MAGGGVQKIYMVLLREPSRRDRSGSDLFHLRDGFEIKMNFDRNVSCFIRFDLSAKALYVSEQPVSLTKSEYSICEYLAKNRGQVFTKEQIYEAVFGFDGIGDNSTISTHIKNIRAKLEHFKISPISTVWGIGYKWE